MARDLLRKGPAHNGGPKRRRHAVRLPVSRRTNRQSLRSRQRQKLFSSFKRSCACMACGHATAATINDTKNFLPLHVDLSRPLYQATECIDRGWLGVPPILPAECIAPCWKPRKWTIDSLTVAAPCFHRSRSSWRTDSCDQAFRPTNDLDVFFVKRRRTRFQPSIPRTANCPFDSREQGFLLQRLPKASYKRTFVRCFWERSVGMRCDEDCWNFNAVAYEMMLKLQAVHLWHLKIYNQAQRKPSR